MFIADQDNSLNSFNTLNLFLEASPLVAYELSGTSFLRHTFVSENSAKVLGYIPAKFIIGENFWLDRIHPQDRDAVASVFREIQLGDVQTLNYRFRHKKGHYCWVQDSFRVVNRNGELAILGSWLDISEQETLRRALAKKETELAQAKQFTEEVLGAIAYPIFIKDHRHHWIYANQALESFMGLSIEMMLGKTDYDLFAPAQADIFRMQDVKVRRHKQTEQIKETVIDPQGNEHCIWTTKKVFTTDQEYLLGVVLDVTEQQKNKSDLNTSLQRFKKLSNNVPGVIYQFQRQADGHYIFTHISRYCEELFGYAPVEIIANANLVFGNAHPEDLDALIESIELAAKKRENWQYEWRMISPITGKIKWLQGKSEASQQA
ncbi:MAG: PAS domain-containing protein, partial [Limnothrix sp. RL_2_0]|nr:PAS domain-containing protein [Limnothrix sp. RL_2_0]